MSSHIEVVALEAGHDGRVYRSAGERWSVRADDFVKDDKSGKVKHVTGQTWFVPAELAPPPAEKPKDKRPPGAGPAKGSNAAG